MGGTIEMAWSYLVMMNLKVSERVKIVPKPILQVLIPLVKNHRPPKNLGMMHLLFLQFLPFVYLHSQFGVFTQG